MSLDGWGMKLCYPPSPKANQLITPIILSESLREQLEMPLAPHTPTIFEPPSPALSHWSNSSAATVRPGLSNGVISTIPHEDLVVLH